MRIAIIIPIIGTFGRRGYYNSQEIGLAKELKQYGHTVDIYKGVSKISQDKTETEEKEFGRIIYCPVKSFGPHGLFNMSYLDKTPDAILVFSDTQLFIKRIFKYCEEKKIPFIPYVGIAHSFQKNLKSKIIDKIFEIVTVPLYRKSIVLAKTKSAADELIQLNIKNVIFAPVGLDFDKLNSEYEKVDRTELRKKYGFSNKDFVIAFIGRLHPKKHPIEMIDIFKQVNVENKKLLIVGKGQLETEIKNRIDSYDLRNYVKQIDEIEYENIWEAHWISDVMINLCEWEIFGMAIMEAIYYKTSVVAISAPGPNTIIEKMPGNYICENYREVINTIDKMQINSMDLERAKKELISSFSWKNTAQIINKIINRKMVLV